MSQSFNAEHRFGSAAWAQTAEIRAAGLMDGRGPHIGFHEQTPLNIDGDAPIITIAGAGAGKLRDQLAYVMCGAPGLPTLALDPRGELSAVSMIAHALHGEFAYCWDPIGVGRGPAHSCNLLDILRADSPSLHGDVKFVMEGLFPSSGSKENQYFEQRGREWTGAIALQDVLQSGGTSLPRIYRAVNRIESGDGAWADWLEAMLASPFEHVRRVAAEMLTKQQDSPREFGSIMGEIYSKLSFLDDPALQRALEGGDFSLDALTSPARTAKIFINVPAEYLSIWSPVIRLFFTVAMLYKARKPSAPRVLLLVDEAGQLGNFEALLRAFTYGRGAGLRAWALFQDAGQIQRNFGAPALQSFLGSAETRQFFGVRDYQTAKLVSDMLGQQTLEFDDPTQQARARQQRYHTARRVLHGEDPLQAAYDYRHFELAAGRKTKQARALMTPDEILAMPEDRQILFISGKDLPPVPARKYAYFTRREMAGRYLPNPAHPPLDQVRIEGRWGPEWRDVITAPVPPKWRDYPQYAHGHWSYVQGFEPA